MSLASPWLYAVTQQVISKQAYNVQGLLLLPLLPLDLLLPPPQLPLVRRPSNLDSLLHILCGIISIMIKLCCLWKLVAR